ncbi:MAG: hypothetical protein HZB09_00095 [Candidatus Yonathbacteria bacterium]|nr:hypothetical protein [Candidatus Yonathbacteria bacterium]
MPQFLTKKIIASGVLAVLAAAGIALYISQQQAVSVIDNNTSGGMRVVHADHYFENGTHTYKGILTVPTPCHELISQVTVMESYPEQVTIDLKEQGASNFCAQVITQTPFEVSFKASQDARVSLKLNGAPALFKVTEKSDTKNIPPTTATTTSKTPSDSSLYEGRAAQ